MNNPLATAFFLLFVLVTIIITIRAARARQTTAEVYTGRGLSPLANGLAIAGDYMSAAAFLGVSAMISTSGFDGMLYGIGFVSGWPVALILIAGKLRRMGRYTFACALATRIDERSARTFAAASSLVVVMLYLIGQLVGAGQLIRLLFGFDTITALALVGVLMTGYVVFGGMLATSWVQIIKAGLLLGGTAVMTILLLARFDFSFSQLLRTAIDSGHRGPGILAPTAIHINPISGFSLALALMFGTSGLPHILMRLFTVADARAARRSIAYACALNGLFFLMVFVIGFGTIALITPDPRFHTPDGHVLGGANMVAIHLASALGGSVLLGFIAAVAFATILAVVAGLTLSGAVTIARDIGHTWFPQIGDRRERMVFRAGAIGIGVTGVALAYAFRNQNVAYMVGLAFSVAASANFPVLLLALHWSRLTTAGALVGGMTGLLGAVGLTVVGPAIWVKVLGHAAPIFPYDPPTLLTMPAAFIVAIAVSLLTPRRVIAVS